MKTSLVPLLRCPLTQLPLQLKVIENYDSQHPYGEEIKSGFLYADGGGVFPIINGIPRMLPESFLTYEKELTVWDEGYLSRKKDMLYRYGKIIQSSAEANKKIQSTFSFEWGLLKNDDRLKIWNLDREAYNEQLLKELSIHDSYTCNTSLDAGCGHGRSTRLLANRSKQSVGIEISDAVEIGYHNNNNAQCHFIQGSILFLPFSNEIFDLVYCSGVLHHNPSTKESLLRLSRFLKPNGLLCIWLYHPFQHWLHHVMCAYRRVTSNVPVMWVYYLNCITLTPLQWFVSQVKGQKKKFTEIAIEQLDILTPAYRHEHTHEEVVQWLQEDGFDAIKTTTQDDYGFSMKAIKQAQN